MFEWTNKFEWYQIHSKNYFQNLYLIKRKHLLFVSSQRAQSFLRGPPAVSPPPLPFSCIQLGPCHKARWASALSLGQHSLFIYVPCHFCFATFIVFHTNEKKTILDLQTTRTHQQQESTLYCSEQSSNHAAQSRYAVHINGPESIIDSLLKQT